MGSKKRIRPPHAEPASGRIKARESATGSTDGLTPVFCLRHLSPEWAVSKCERDDQGLFAVRLEVLSKLTWKEIRNAPRHGLGTEKINRSAIKAPIPEAITEDVEFLALRFSGKKAMVGFRNNDVFHVVWLDRDFSLYDH